MSVCVCVCVRLCVCARAYVCACVCVQDHHIALDGHRADRFARECMCLCLSTLPRPDTHSFTRSHLTNADILYVCVCVCVRKREREKKRKREIFTHSFMGL